MDYLRTLKRALGIICLSAVLLSPSVHAGAFFGLIGNPRVQVSGFGLFGDISLAHTLDILEPRDESLKVFSNIYIEDALWILSGELKRRGYLYPAIEARLSQENTLLWQGRWQSGQITPLLPPQQIGDAVSFQIAAGVLFHFNTIQVKGLPAEIKQNPNSFFYATDRLFLSASDRYFSAGRLAAGVDAIELTLHSLGYRDATAKAAIISENASTGAVDVNVEVDAGPLYFIEKLSVVIDDGSGERLLTQLLPTDQRFDASWIHIKAQEIRNLYYKRGHPEVVVSQKTSVVNQGKNTRKLDITLTVTPGPVVRINEVVFKNAENISATLLERQADLHEGDLLDRSQVEIGRERLSRLGVFRSIRIDYEKNDDDTWNVVYDTNMKKETTVNLIFGVGSFDIVRGGFEVEQNNLWDRGHHAHLSVVQSIKATYADYTYTIPQIAGKDLDFFLSANYLNRKELSFDREEYGGSIGLQHFFTSINTAASIQYNYGLVEARNLDFTNPPGPTKSIVSSISLKANRSELDNPIYPTDGWQVFGTSEFAFTQLGGDVGFQRIEVGGAWHKPVSTGGLVFHAGYKTGVVTSTGPVIDNIPVPTRFFLGGENTVRGYKRDQASPLNAQGQQIGAVSYMLWQIEFEQRLTENFSFVTFCDTVGNAEQISEYPFNEVLVSVGVGISIRTVVGPLRIEYGYNVKKRPGDPIGMFQVALGFPF